MKKDLRGLEGLYELLGDPFDSPVAAVDTSTIPERLRGVLGVPPRPDTIEVLEDGRWTRAGIEGTRLRWNVGFGPDTQAWLLRPQGARGPLPGVLALHCHGGQKFFGKEKIADGPEERLAPQIAQLRRRLYGGRALAEVVAARGYAVLVHDVFGWGSRRYPEEFLPPRAVQSARHVLAATERSLSTPERYDVLAGFGEDTMAKTLGLLGTSWGGVVAREDLIAARVLRERVETRDEGIVAVGLSGGGARAGILSALAAADVRAAGIVSMMSTFGDILDGWLHFHTWMLMNPGMARVGEWPDIVASRAPRPLFVSYSLDDRIIPRRGMERADARLREFYASAGATVAYRSHFGSRPHSFSVEAQEAFLEWMGSLP